MNPAQKLGGRIFEISAGVHIFRLDRTEGLLLEFYYASPGTDTRVATIDLKEIPFCNQASIGFTWSPNDICLYFIPKIKDAKVFSDKGRPCKFQLRIGEDGCIYQIGSENIRVMNVSFFQGTKQVLSPTAIDSWRDTKKALEILETGKSNEGCIYESIVANLTISILVTGFESYAKKRVLELEKEGVKSQTEAFFSDSEKEKIEVYKKEAEQKKITLLQHIVEKRVINFQNYEECKHAFNKIFQISFGTIGVESITIKELKEFIKFRHKIIHISALIGILNLESVPHEEPIFSNKILAEKAIGVFDAFIGKLHEATLKNKIEQACVPA